MKKEEIKKAIQKLKKCISKKSSLSILGNVLNDNGTMTVSTLDMFLTVNTGFPGKFLIDFKQLEKVVNKLPTCADIEIGLNGDRVELVTGKGAKFGFASPDVADFPTPEECKKPIGSFNKDQIAIVKKAVKFVSTDVLRPVMHGVFVADHIAASDAHRLVYYQYDKTLSEEILISPKVALMMNFSDYKVYITEAGTTHIKLVSENETITFREIEGKFPNYQSIIPEKSPIKITVNTKDLADTVKLALIAASEHSLRVSFEFEDGELIIKSEDLDYETSFSSKITTDNEKDEIVIGIKGTFLLEMLADCEEKVTLKMTDACRAILIDDNKLVMPMML